jgi:hypothetical protein
LDAKFKQFIACWIEPIKTAKEAGEKASKIAQSIGFALASFVGICGKWGHVDVNWIKDIISFPAVHNGAMIVAAGIVLRAIFWTPFARNEALKESHAKELQKQDLTIKAAADAKVAAAKGRLVSFGENITKRILIVAQVREYDAGKDDETYNLSIEIVAYITMDLNDDARTVYEEGCDPCLIGMFNGTRWEIDKQKVTKLLNRRLRNIRQLLDNIDKYLRP